MAATTARTNSPKAKAKTTPPRKKAASEAVGPTTWVPEQFPVATFADRLRLLRFYLRMTQPQLAKLCGVGAETWNKWERNKHLPSDLAGVVEKISEATGVDRSWLVFGPAPQSVHLDRPVMEGETADRTGVLVAA